MQLLHDVPTLFKNKVCLGHHIRCVLYVSIFGVLCTPSFSMYTILGVPYTLGVVPHRLHILTEYAAVMVSSSLPLPLLLLNGK